MEGWKVRPKKNSVYVRKMAGRWEGEGKKNLGYVRKMVEGRKVVKKIRTC